MSLAILVFARMDSRRLPGKAMRDVAGRPLVGRVIDRVRKAMWGGPVILATSDRPIDEPLVAFARAEGIAAFRGDAHDVAGRALACCDALGLEACVRISGDSPYLPPELIDSAAEIYRARGVDLVTNVFPRTYPPGASVEIVTRAALARAHPHMTADDRENVTTIFYRDARDWRIANLSAEDDRYAGVRLTVDTPDEMTRAVAIAHRLGAAPEVASLDTVVAACRSVMSTEAGSTQR